MLDFAILGLLHDEARHGYELRKQLAEYGFWSVSFGSLYPALRRMERNGLIEVAGETGRRKAYRLTAIGKEHFNDMLMDDGAEGDEERAFNLKLAFFRYTEPEVRLGVLERRRAHLQEKLARTNSSLRRVGSRTKEKMDRYTLSLMEHGVRSAEADLAWLDELIETERAERPRRKRRAAPHSAGAAVTE